MLLQGARYEIYDDRCDGSGSDPLDPRDGGGKEDGQGPDDQEPNGPAPVQEWQVPFEEVIFLYYNTFGLLNQGVPMIV
jgi:hypothetical protein